MFGKLLKYEFKSIGKWYLTLYALAFFIAIILGLLIRQVRSLGSLPDIASVVTGLLILAFASIMIALAISTLVIIIKRFYDNILGRQGYLTMTLPVTTHQILLSKAAAAIVWCTLAIITTIFSYLFLGLVSSGSVGRFLIGLSLLAQEIGRIFSYVGATFFLFLLWGLVSTFTSIFHIYFSMSLGHLAQKNRVFLSFVAFFAIIFGLSIVSSLLFTGQNNPLLIQLNSIGHSPSEEEVMETFRLINSRLIVDTLYQLVLSIGYYFGVHYIIKNKLNIQ